MTAPARQLTPQSGWPPARCSGSRAPTCTAARSSVADPLKDYQHPINIEEFRALGYEAVDMICSYISCVLPNTRVVPDVKPGYLHELLPACAPLRPEPWQQIKRDFWDKIMKGVTHWQSPNYFSWFPANTSLPGILAEMLVAALNMVGFNWESGPVSTELEMVVLDWLVRLCGLPKKFLWHDPDPNSSSDSNGSSSSSAGSIDGSSSSSSSSREGSGSSSCSREGSGSGIGGGGDSGNGSSSEGSGSGTKSPGGVIQNSSSEAVLVAMLAARARALSGRPREAALQLVAYSTDQAHCCFTKAAMVAGIQHVRLLSANRGSDYAVQPQQLEQAVAADLSQDLIPFYFMASIGTTSSCAVDPVSELADVCLRHRIWMHVDAAWAGTAAILPEQRHWFSGLGKVDSYSFNPYKWMLTPMGVCACWFDDSTHLKEALSLTPTYLRAAQGGMPEFKDWEIPLGRRFRALDLWFVLRMYGIEKLQALVRHHIALGEWLAQQVQADSRCAVVTGQELIGTLV